MTAWQRLAQAGAALALVGATALHAADADPATAWQALTPQQREALAPLQGDWGRFDAQRRSKWLAFAQRYEAMAPEYRHRLHARMAEWAQMSPAEHDRARLQFQQTRQLPASERQLQWQAYQSLSDEQRRALARRRAPPARSGDSPPLRTTPQAIVAPTIVQARPGATTTPLSVPATPPPHHQAGLPKIVAVPGFVDPDTLLPQRGPQGAAGDAAVRERKRRP